MKEEYTQVIRIFTPHQIITVRLEMNLDFFSGGASWV